MKSLHKDVFLVALVLTVSSLSAAQTTTQSSGRLVSGASNVDLTLINQDPVEAQPGGYVDLKFKISNRGTIEASDTTIRLKEEFPFSLDPGKSASRKLGDIRPAAIQEDAYIVEYRVRVNESALTTDNEITVVYETGDVKVSRDFDVDIEETGTSFDISKNTVSESRLNLQIANTGDKDASSVQVKLPDQEGLSTSGIKTQTLDSLNSGSSKKISFPIQNISTDSKYRIEIHYTDSNGVRREKAETFSVDRITSQPVEVVVQNLRGQDITFAVANTGSNSLSSVITRLKAQSAIRGSSSQVLGNLEPGDYTLATYSFSTRPDELELEISYTDTSGLRRSKTFDLNTPNRAIRTSSDTDSDTEDSGSSRTVSYIIIGIVGLVAVAGYFVYRRRS